MERLTKRSNSTIHENGVCCTHFRSPECYAVDGNCAFGCKWEEAAWERLAAYEDTGLTPDQASTAKVLIDAVFTEDTGKMERIRELTKADECGRVVVLAEGSEQQNPCRGCDEGWETVTTAGTRTCHETCERFRKYEEKLEAREAKEDACL